MIEASHYQCHLYWSESALILSSSRSTGSTCHPATSHYSAAIRLPLRGIDLIILLSLLLQLPPLQSSVLQCWAWDDLIPPFQLIRSIIM